MEEALVHGMKGLLKLTYDSDCQMYIRVLKLGSNIMYETESCVCHVYHESLVISAH